jgi:fructan beta-fructosidase
MIAKFLSNFSPQMITHMKNQPIRLNPSCFVLLLAATTGLAAGDVTSAVAPVTPESREITLTGKLLIIPIAKGQAPVDRKNDHIKLSVRVDGKLVHDLALHLAQTKEEVTWWAALDMSKHVGKKAVLAMSDLTDSPGLAMIESSDRERYVLPLYDEALRPQFHFSQRLGWNNDVNGLVYENGEWHLYYQYCPVALFHADKHWGHAVSKDLVHWEELPVALYPITQAKGQCFSGSAVVDHHNTAGFQTGAMPPIIAVFSDFGAGVGEALAYSNDHGRTFTYYDGNPVLKHHGNDPRVIWYKYGKNDKPLNDEAQKLGGHWVLVAYDKTREFDMNMAFYTSIDLKKWTEQSHLPGYGECPEIIELPVDPSPSNKSAGTSGDQQNTRWVVFDAGAQYAVGRFDGRTFTPEHEGKHRVHHGAYFASQTFTNAPDGRCIQMAWARLNLPGMPFTQAFTFPHQLTLRETPVGIRMFAQPVEEIAKLRIKSHTGAAGELTPEAPRKVAVSGELFEVRAEFVLGQAKVVGLDIGGNRVTHNVALDGKVTMQVLLDRPMIETCLNHGESYTTEDRGKRGAVASVSAFAVGGTATLKSFEVHELKSIWKK